MVYATESAAPPLASASTLVRMTPSMPTTLLNSRACSTASFPASESPTKTVRSGRATRRIFAISSMRFVFVCIRPAVSRSTTSFARLFA